MEMGVDYISSEILESKYKKRQDKRVFEEYLDCYFKKMVEGKVGGYV